MRSAPFVVREATEADLPELVHLNQLAYPDLAEDNVVWTHAQVASHRAVFPEGQLVVAQGNRLLGAASSLLVDLGRDPLRRHTWAGVTDDGYFANHDPFADTLYGADVYVHPAARGIGVGAALYEGRRRLCRRLGLRRILSGGRLAHLYRHPTLTAEGYVAKVQTGELHDPVLSFQLREGFVVRGILFDYLRDPASRNYATLIEWLNPAFVARAACTACGQSLSRRLPPPLESPLVTSS
jgi:GNAT superfamily N-acetyltransferase